MSNISKITLPNGNVYDLKDANALRSDAIASFHSQLSSYQVGDYCVHDNRIYRCIEAHEASASWPSDKFQEVRICDKFPNIFYGTCATTASTQTKAIVCPQFTSNDFIIGTILFVKFTNAQSYNGAPLLNVNSTGAMSIKRVGTTNAARYEWVAGELIMFVWDGTNWTMLDAGIATTSYYGATKLYGLGISHTTSYAQTPGGALAGAATLTQGEEFTPYSTSSTYAIGAKVVYNGNAYVCTTAIPVKESWNAEHWTMIQPLQAQINGKADSSHAHAASDISSGIISSANLPIATSNTPGIVVPDGTTISVSNGVIAAIGGSGSGSDVQIAASYSSGTKVATISVDGNPTSIYVPNSAVGSSRYALVTAQLQNAGSSISCQIDDQTVTTIQVSSDTTPVIVKLPEAPQDGARDFILRVEISSSVAPTFTFSGIGESIEFDSEDESWAVLEPGVNLISFTETRRSS